MALTSVRVKFGGVWYDMALNPGTGRYEAAVTAPGSPQEDFPVVIQAVNAKGYQSQAETSIDVKWEVTPPVVAITAPAPGSWQQSAQTPIVFTLTDEAGGSGIDLQSLSFVLDDVSFGSTSPGMTCTPSASGYDCAYVSPQPLSEGMHTVSVTVADMAGNLSGTASVSFGIDLYPPSVAITSPADGFVTAEETVSVSGTASDAGGGISGVTVNGTPASMSGNGFSAVIPLSGGQNAVTAVATDALGHSAQAAITVSRAVSGPALAISYPADGAVVSAASMTVTGTVSDNVSTVAGVTVNGQPALVADGAFSASISLSPGVNTITAEAVNAVGLSTVQSITVTLDTVPPVITLTAPAQGAILSDNNVTVTGTASDDGSGIASLTVNGQEVPVGEGGAFSAIVQIPDGAGSITAVAVDRAGLSSQQTVHVIVDTTPPVVAITAPAPGSWQQSAQTPIVFTLTDEAGGSGIDLQSLSFVLDDVSFGSTSPGMTCTPSASGYDCAYVSPQPLSEGMHTVSVTVADMAGNLSGTASVSFGIDLYPPSVAITSPADGFVTAEETVSVSGTASDAGGGISGVTVNGTPASMSGNGFSAVIPLSGGQNAVTAVATDALGHSAQAAITVSRAVSGPALAISYPADGAVVSAASMTVTGTVSDNVSTVAGVTVNGQPALVADGAFSASISLSPGVNTITAEAVNAVGLSTVQSITVTLDTVPPVITLTAPAQGAILSDNNVTVTGTASDDGSGIASLTVNGQEVPVGEGGAFSAIVQIPDGAGSITAVAVDRAGLSSQQTVHVIVDTTPPALTVDSPAEGEITSQASLLVSGTASDPISGVQQVLVNGQPAALSEGAFSIEVSLSEGLNTITVSALNAAGLSASVTRSVMLDSVPPLLTVSSPTAGEMTGIADFVLSGTVSDATSGVASVTINGLPALVQDGAFSQPVILDEGQNTFVFTATDNAGLQTTVTRTVLLDTAAPALAVTSPVDDLITNIPALTIAGTVSDSGSGLEGVTVNGDAVQVTDGAFSLDVLLTEGDNTFSVVAADLLGHTSTVTRSVLLDTTAPVIEAVTLTPDFSADPIGNRFVLTVLLAPSPAPKAAETVTGTVNGKAVSFSESPALMWTALVPRGDGFAVKLTASDAAGNVTTASLFFPDGLESKLDWTTLDFLNYWDLNRVERNTDFILRILRQCGYNPKNYGIDRDWAMPDIPTRSQIDRVRRNVDALQEGFLLLPEWREIVYNNTVDAGQMNAIEWDLRLLDQWLVRLQKGVFIYSGDVFAGEV